MTERRVLRFLEIPPISGFVLTVLVHGKYEHFNGRLCRPFMSHSTLVVSGRDDQSSLRIVSGRLGLPRPLLQDLLLQVPENCRLLARFIARWLEQCGKRLEGSPEHLFDDGGIRTPPVDDGRGRSK